MAERGHEVTVVSPFPLKEQIKNHREIKVPIVESFRGKAKAMSENKYLKGLFGFFYYLHGPWIEMGIEATKTEEFQKLLNEEFDLIVVGFVLHNFLLGYGDHFKCPTVILSAQKNFYLTNFLSGNPVEIHTAPSFDLQKSELSFSWRVKNFVLTGSEILLSFYIEYYQEKVYK